MGVIKYKTKQQELLLSCFKAMQGRHFTAEDVSAYFQKKNISIGIATILWRWALFKSISLANRMPPASNTWAKNATKKFRIFT